MEERRLGFDDMPKLVSSLITEVKTLSIKMDTVCKMVGNAKSTGKKILSIDEVAEISQSHLYTRWCPDMRYLTTSREMYFPS